MARYSSQNHDKSHEASFVAWVFVLGDFGRSPRMQYHTQSLALQPNTSAVHVIAYGGAAPLESLRSHPKVHINTLPEVPKLIMRLPGVLRLAFKVLHQLLALAWLMLVRLPAPATILMQNPPAIPSMALCWLAARRHRARLVIDWHNFGWSIMALKHNPQGALVRLARAHELAWGRAADDGLCVTVAMQRELRERWRIPTTVLYDRPPAHFQRTPLPVCHDLFVRLVSDLAGPPSYRDFATSEAPTWGPGRTAVTACGQLKADSASDSSKEPGGAGGARKGTVAGGAGGASYASWRSDRPAVVVSSTSWTPDEDFGILLEALVLYERAVTGQEVTGPAVTGPPSTSQRDGAAGGAGERGHGGLPPLLVLITGRGPQREMYLRRIAQLQLKAVAVRSLWLEASDYPLLLGAADLGVSLHASSSGLDLPMKVVDMFGSGLPVCALAYNCIHELVEDGQTGLLFSSPQQLCDQLQTLLRGFPGSVSQQLQHMQRQVAEKEQGLRWEENWEKVAWPVLKQAAAEGQ